MPARIRQRDADRDSFVRTAIDGALPLRGADDGLRRIEAHALDV